STGPDCMAQAVYAATLTGPLDYTTGLHVVTQTGIAATSAAAGQLLRDHRVCYPTTAPDAVLEPLYPDRLGEDFIALTTPGHGIDAHPTDAWAATAVRAMLAATRDDDEPHVIRLPGYTVQAVTVLIETAIRWPHIAHQQLYPLLREQPWLALAAGGNAMTRLAGIDHVDVD